MSMIIDLISNISKYGNTKLYLKATSPKVNYVYNYIVDDNGNLVVTANYEKYDKPYWNGKTFDNSANLVTSFEVDTLNEFYIPLKLAAIVLNSFYKFGISLQANEVPITKDTSKAVNTIYQMVLPMLQLSTKDLMTIVTDGSSDFEYMLFQKVPEDIRVKDVIPASVVVEDVDKQLNAVLDRFTSFRDIWKKVENAHNIDEYDEAVKKWCDLRQSDMSDESLTSSGRGLK